MNIWADSFIQYQQVTTYEEYRSPRDPLFAEIMHIFAEIMHIFAEIMYIFVEIMHIFTETMYFYF